MLSFARRNKAAFANIPVARKLREVVKISLLEREDTETIKDIWGKFHAGKKHLVAQVGVPNNSRP